jgi:hypothetical protein
MATIKQPLPNSVGDVAALYLPSPYHRSRPIFLAVWEPVGVCTLTDSEPNVSTIRGAMRDQRRSVEQRSIRRNRRLRAGNGYTPTGSWVLHGRLVSIYTVAPAPGCATSLAAREITRMTAFLHIASAGVAFYAIFTSMMIVVVLHHSLLAYGSAITLSGAVFAPGSPSAIEIADRFDAVIATVVPLAIALALTGSDPQLNIRSLRKLRG